MGRAHEKGPLREAISTVLKQSNSRASLRTQQIHYPQANDMGLKLKRCIKHISCKADMQTRNMHMHNRV